MEETDSCRPAKGLSIPARGLAGVPPGPGSLSGSSTLLTSDSTDSRSLLSSAIQRPAWRIIAGSRSGPRTKSATVRMTMIFGRLRSSTHPA